MEDFQAKVLKLVKKIPKGRVTTYKEIAKALDSRAYRLIGNILGKNPNLIKIPCHRVVRSDGKIGNYALGQRRKKELLQKEGVEIVGEKIDLNKYFYALT